MARRIRPIIGRRWAVLAAVCGILAALAFWKSASRQEPHGNAPKRFAAKPVPQSELTKGKAMTDITEPHIFLDRSGDLRTGYFYTVEFDQDAFPGGGPPLIQFASNPEKLLAELDDENFPDRPGAGEIVVKRKGLAGYFEVMFESSFLLKTEKRKDCPVDPTHVTQAWWKDLKVLDGSDCDGVADPFVRLIGGEFVLLIRDDLLQDLKESKLTGWRAAEVIFATQDGEELGRTRKPQGYPKLWDFQFRGRAHLRSLSVRNAPNACPFCGYGRLICPGCQWMVSRCPKCEALPWATPQMVRLREKEGKQLPQGTLIWEGVQQSILQGEHWDGSDFIQIGQGGEGADYEPYDGDKHIITKRALDWLLARHANPLWAKPIPVDVSKMSNEQLQTLEAAKDLKSLE